MIRARLLAILVGMVATLAVSAAPAFAEFDSLTAKVKGLGHSGALVLEGGGATLECASTQGEWEILSTAGGTPATRGNFLQLKIKTWNGCTVKTSIAKGVNADVIGCLLEFEQAAGATKAKGSTVTECTVEVKVLGTCIVSIPPGQKGLETNFLENAGQDLILNADDSGITVNPKGSCLGVSKTTNAKLKATFTLGGLKLV